MMLVQQRARRGQQPGERGGSRGRDGRPGSSVRRPVS